MDSFVKVYYVHFYLPCGNIVKRQVFAKSDFSAFERALILKDYLFGTEFSDSIQTIIFR